jgi:phage shock protein A
MADVGLAIDRAENKKEEIKARAVAIDELMKVGALEDLTGDSKGYIDSELSKINTKSNVESELSTLKAELGKGQAKTGEKEQKPKNKRSSESDY